jgi:hypothetical protein
MKKPWRVRFHYSNKNYEEILDFETEAKARKLYDRVKKHGFLSYCMIFHRLEAVSNRLGALALEAITCNRKLKREWAKLKPKDKAKVEALLKKGALELVKDVLE